MWYQSHCYENECEARGARDDGGTSPPDVFLQPVEDEGRAHDGHRLSTQGKPHRHRQVLTVLVVIVEQNYCIVVQEYCSDSC